MKLKDGRASLFHEHYLGRSESPVLDENGEQVYYTSGVMKGKPKFSVKHLKRLGNTSEIKKWISWHGSRHSFAFNVLDKGVNIKTVSTLMGHCGISTTEKYLHVLDRQKQDAVDSLGSIDFSME